jgi:hypothetical protein
MNEPALALSFRGTKLLQNHYDCTSDDDNNSPADFDVSHDFNLLELNSGDEGTEYQSQTPPQPLNDSEATKN